MICFEFPLVERVRIFLRLESLFNRFDFLVTQADSCFHHYALQSIFEIMETATRSDLKTDILQEIERQKQIFIGLKDNPAVDEKKLNNALFLLGDAATQLQSICHKFGSHLRENEWLMSIKQRMGVVGGSSQFDLPSYHFWLSSPDEKRRQDLNNWASSLRPTFNAIKELLKILREGAEHHNFVAKAGIYQQSSLSTHIHLLRIHLEPKFGAVPEVSANKYMTNIRFVQATTKESKGKQIPLDIPFTLDVCKF
ncbi:cell division protein ZapD [Neisseria sp. Ec49-e6-T10]|uniref:cell division protein ZapD n=1 Tax=Neisseria sp. Ec49-e6-T10 TaxID=3140744 RepID=UPI003EB7D894